MAHVHDHRRETHRGGGGFGLWITVGVVVLALLIGWAVWAGKTPDGIRDGRSVELNLPRASELPAMPNPEPLPTPLPTRPG